MSARDALGHGWFIHPGACALPAFMSLSVIATCGLCVHLPLCVCVDLYGSLPDMADICPYAGLSETVSICLYLCLSASA